jgi:hypothetical protein
MPLDDAALVTLYLLQLKALIGQKRISFWNRDKNLQTLARLGITHEHRIEILQSLLPRNFSHMLDTEPGHAAGCWIFGVREQGVEIYIKIKIVETSHTGEQAVCVSFHEAERPLEYPFGG